MIKVIITGATGMVGEGVLLECLESPEVEEVLILNRKHYSRSHPKLKEIIVPDFFDLSAVHNQLKGYNACFFCAGVSSLGMKEAEYTHLTYDLTLSVAQFLSQINPEMTFTYVSGSHTDSTEKGRLMWARVKGKTENDLSKLPFKAEYNFRPGVMLPFEGQQNWKGIYKFIGKAIQFFAPKKVLTMEEVGRAMINAVLTGYSKPVLEIDDIKRLAHHQPVLVK